MDIEQASRWNILHTIEWTLLTLRGQEPDWVVVQRDHQPFLAPYPPYAEYDHLLAKEHWVGWIAPKGTPWANALYRREVIVTLTPGGRFCGIPRALGANKETLAS